jgi:inner membrane protein
MCWQKLKNKTILYGSILGTIPDVVVGLFFRSCKCSPDSPRHQSFALSFFFIPLLVGLFQNWKNKIDFQASYMVLVSVYPCIIRYVYLLGTQILWPLDYRFALKQSLW